MGMHLLSAGDLAYFARIDDAGELLSLEPCKVEAIAERAGGEVARVRLTRAGSRKRVEFAPVGTLRYGSPALVVSRAAVRGARGSHPSIVRPTIGQPSSIINGRGGET